MNEIDHECVAEEERLLGRCDDIQQAAPALLPIRLGYRQWSWGKIHHRFRPIDVEVPPSEAPFVAQEET